MTLFDHRHLNLPAAIIAGGAAGIISGFVKLGWENVLPPPNRKTRRRQSTRNLNETGWHSR